MDFYPTANGSVRAVARDFGKKKRTNRLAKLKQTKRDARREQWLSQAKNKGNKEELNEGGGSPPSLSLPNEGNPALENREMGSKEEENEGLSVHDSDLESLMNSSTTDSRKDRPGSSCGSSSSGCFTGTFSEEEDNECLDDWEAVADALTADDKKHQHQNSDHSAEPETCVESDSPVAKPKLSNNPVEVRPAKPECRNMIPRTNPHIGAWRSDDAFRPQSLPSLCKRNNPTLKTEQRHIVRGWETVSHKNKISQPSSCPICYEDLDITDSSFQPCICGFSLCLFCHKRIFEVGDSRCPGCRRPYDPVHLDSIVSGVPQPIVNRGIQALGRSCYKSKRSSGKLSH